MHVFQTHFALVHAFVVHRTTTPGRIIWCAGLSCLSRSSNQINQKNQTDEMNQRDQTNQIPATRREMLDRKI